MLDDLVLLLFYATIAGTAGLVGCCIAWVGEWFADRRRAKRIKNIVLTVEHDYQDFIKRGFK